MAKLKNGKTLRKVTLKPETVKVRSRPSRKHAGDVLNKVLNDERRQARKEEAAAMNQEPHRAQPSRDGVIIVGDRGFRIDDVSGRAAIAQFRRPAGTPSYFEVFGKDKPEKRSVGENVMIVRAWMHLEGLPPIPERESIVAFATLCARHLLPRHKWPLFTRAQRPQAEAFISEWASRLYQSVADGRKAKPQQILPGWAQPDRAAFYTPCSIAQAKSFGNEGV